NSSRFLFGKTIGVIGLKSAVARKFLVADFNSRYPGCLGSSGGIIISNERPEAAALNFDEINSSVKTESLRSVILSFGKRPSLISWIMFIKASLSIRSARAQLAASFIS